MGNVIICCSGEALNGKDEVLNDNYKGEENQNLNNKNYINNANNHNYQLEIPKLIILTKFNKNQNDLKNHQVKWKLK